MQFAENISIMPQLRCSASKLYPCSAPGCVDCKDLLFTVKFIKLQLRNELTVFNTKMFYGNLLTFVKHFYEAVSTIQSYSSFKLCK